jgi:hypothetical protein
MADRASQPLHQSNRVKEVLRVPDYFLHPFGIFLNPLSHVRLLMILPRNPLQNALSGGGESMNRNRVTIIEPKMDSGVKLGSSSQPFIYNNRCRWIVWHDDVSSLTTSSGAHKLEFYYAARTAWRRFHYSFTARFRHKKPRRKNSVKNYMSYEIAWCWVRLVIYFRLNTTAFL